MILIQYYDKLLRKWKRSESQYFYFLFFCISYDRDSFIYSKFETEHL